VRVIENKYPAVVAGAEENGWATNRSDMDAAPCLYSSWPGIGRHEVVVESPQHSVTFADLTPEQAYWTFVAYRDRVQSMAADSRLRFGMVFKNCRGGGGATLEHSHSQILATTAVPWSVANELSAAEDHFRRVGGCLFCAIVEREVALGERIVMETDRLVAFCPFASRFPYEVCVLPRAHAACFQLAELAELEELSGLFQRFVRGLENLLPQTPHNFWIHTLPFDTFCYDHYHWHIELIPRTSTQAGFEWGSGCFINPVAPEDAASALRQAAS
jgi:UDPglucose--hexose-1-phosphate uridylyltransferase